MFLVWDAYRPLSVQKALFDYFVQKLISERGGTTSDYLIEAQKFVSLPSDDKTKPSPHSTGAVVDLTIIEFTETGWAELQVLNSKLFDCKNEKERFEIEMKRFQLMRTESTPLPMGTMFDEVSPATNLYFYEDKTKEEIDIVCRFNRRYLTSRLWNVGFVAYEEEWWHFSHGDQFWAKKFGKTRSQVQEIVYSTFGKVNNELEHNYIAIRAQVLAMIEQLGTKSKLTQKKYHAIVEEAVELYSKGKKWTKEVVAKLVEDLKAEWETIKEGNK